MKKLLALLVIASLVGFVGCTSSTSTGSTKPKDTKADPPKSTKEDPPKSTKEDPPKTAKITLTVPAEVKIAKGKDAKVTVSVKRENAPDEVKLVWGKLPKGVTASENAGSIPSGKDDVEITFKAAADAEGGDLTVEATAGKATDKGKTKIVIE